MKVQHLLICLLVFVVSLGSVRAAERDLLIFAASSMRDVLLETKEIYEGRCDCSLTFSFAASSTLARQIDVGAPADVYISANRAWMDWLGSRGVVENPPEIIARNRLVIASSMMEDIPPAALTDQRFAMGDPTGVPAGIYAKEALEKMQAWDQVKEKAVFTENVRVALSMVARGDLRYGIVYKSDLTAFPELNLTYLFPEGMHTPIDYVAANVTSRGSDFVRFLRSAEAQAVLAQAGFAEVKP